MSVEASEALSDEWTRWQGHVVNGVYPLGRPLGHSDHSGVFVTRSAAPGHGQIAIKLMPAGSDPADPQNSRWLRAGKLAHPHLLPLLESGTCVLEGQPFLYVVMEYADQTLAQLLMQRAMSADEAREMLVPVLDALKFLHEQGLAQGALHPANVLVVGEQLKLASDTVGHPDDALLGSQSPSPYHPPESPQDRGSAAGDIWRLGVTLLEALSRRSSSALGPRSPVGVPADFPPEFREVVGRCLSQKPQDRPTVHDLVAWMDGAPLKPIPVIVSQPAAWTRPEPKTPAAAASPAVSPAASAVIPAISAAVTPPVTPAAVQQVRAAAHVSKPFAWRPATVAAAVILALGAIGVSTFKSRRTPDATAPAAAELASATSAAAAPLTATSVSAPPAPGGALQPLALHEQMPLVSKSAARTIRGHLKVTVKADIKPNGTVSRVVVQQSAPSRYFQQAAVQAAKKWTFAPLPASAARAVEIQFDFTRDGTTAQATPFHKADGAASAAN